MSLEGRERPVVAHGNYHCKHELAEIGECHSEHLTRLAPVRSRESFWYPRAAVNVGHRRGEKDNRDGDEEKIDHACLVADPDRRERGLDATTTPSGES